MTPIVHAPAPTSRPPAGAAVVPENNAIAEQWLAMPHPDLTDHIRRLVRDGSMPSPVWTAAGAHPVLAARVRGILSALHSQMADHRDHTMWTLWITNPVEGRHRSLRCHTTSPSHHRHARHVPGTRPDHDQPSLHLTCRTAPQCRVAVRHPPTAADPDGGSHVRPDVPDPHRSCLPRASGGGPVHNRNGDMPTRTRSVFLESGCVQRVPCLGQGHIKVRRSKPVQRARVHHVAGRTLVVTASATRPDHLPGGQRARSHLASRASSRRADHARQHRPPDPVPARGRARQRQVDDAAHPGRLGAAGTRRAPPGAHCPFETVRSRSTLCSSAWALWRTSRSRRSS
jgi:hypothetical protein